MQQSTTTTITVNHPGLSRVAITVRADSTVLFEDQKGASEWSTGLTVDGRFIPLCLSKFLPGRPALLAAIEAVADELTAAIVASGRTAPAGPDTATTALLASAFKLAHMADAAAGRGADNTVRYLSGAPILDFDASETRALSERKGAGTFYVTDGVHCTCPGAPHVWCKHRIAHRLQLAHLALTDPAELIRQIIAQTMPADAELVAMEDAEAVARVEALLRTPEIVPFDPADDAAYAEALADINALYA